MDPLGYVIGICWPVLYIYILPRHATDKLSGRCQLTKSTKFSLLWFTVAKIAKIYLVKHPKVSVDMCLGT